MIKISNLRLWTRSYNLPWITFWKKWFLEKKIRRKFNHLISFHIFLYLFLRNFRRKFKICKNYTLAKEIPFMQRYMVIIRCYSNKVTKSSSVAIATKWPTNNTSTNKITTKLQIKRILPLVWLFSSLVSSMLHSSTRSSSFFDLRSGKYPSNQLSPS